MPRYRVTVRIYNEWTHDWEADNEQEARELAYEESLQDIGPDDYVEMTAIEMHEPSSQARDAQDIE